MTTTIKASELKVGDKLVAIRGVRMFKAGEAKPARVLKLRPGKGKLFNTKTGKSDEVEISYLDVCIRGKSFWRCNENDTVEVIR